MEQEQDVYAKIERFSVLGFGIDKLRMDKQLLIDSVVPKEVKDKIAEIEEEFEDKIQILEIEKAGLEAQIKQEVLFARRTIKGVNHSFTYTKGRTSWDTELLEKLASTYREIEFARKTGEPSVSIRKK